MRSKKNQKKFFVLLPGWQTGDAESHKGKLHAKYSNMAISSILIPGTKKLIKTKHTMKTTNGKLRNITSGILHTDISDVYEFIERYTGQGGIMTHQLPSACRSLQPILKSKLSEDWFTEDWNQDKKWQDTEIEIPDMTDEEKKEFWSEYEIRAGEMWNEIKDKTITVKI